MGIHATVQARSGFVDLCRRALHCRKCFEDFSIEAPTIDVAQPRWIGPDYWNASPRVLALMTKPGSGEFRDDGVDSKMRKQLVAFRDGELDLFSLLEAQKEDFPVWGRGRFLRFFQDGFGLSIKDIAFANIAWCATQGNSQPSAMLDTCFEKFTRDLLVTLDPAVVLLVGSATHPFGARIRRALPSVTTIPTLHYAPPRECDSRAG